jgi:hypothetical protein
MTIVPMATTAKPTPRLVLPAVVTVLIAAREKAVSNTSAKSFVEPIANAPITRCAEAKAPANLLLPKYTTASPIVIALPV